mgnify:CR=1 FL=1
MISYSTNDYTITNKWYEDRNIPFVMKKSKGIEPFLARDYKDYEEYSCGRIDIYGLDEEEYWCGKHEYSVAPMLTEDWNTLSDWLDKLETETLLTYNELISMFESETGTNMRKNDE